MTNIKTTLLAVGLLLTLSGNAQPTEATTHYRNFPILIKLQFHNLAMPFRDIKANFSNIGIGLGTEVSYNGKSNWVQQVTTTWHHNKSVGNSIMLYSQAAWRPNISAGFYTELKAGAGYKYAFRPVESFQQMDGSWQSVQHKGKGMLVVPLGFSVGYQAPSVKTYVSPFISYQFLLVSGYNTSIPLLPETLIQVGSRIHLNR
jgi:hypothetical protein